MKKLFISLILGLSLISSFAAPSGNTATVNFVWDYDFTTNYISNFKLYFGPSTLNYTNSVTLGMVTNGTIPNLQRGITYYFSCTAIDTNNLESDYSNEVIYTIPKKPGNPRNLIIQLQP